MTAVAWRISHIAGAVFAFLTVNFSAELPLFAQSYTRTNISQAALDLEVIDPEGTPVPGAEVILNEPSRKQRIHGKTDKHGRFVLAGVRGGRYLITVSAPSLVSFPETVDLRSGEKLSLSMTLNFGLVGEIVTIDGPGISVDSVPVILLRCP